jgi:hypothetical protein
MSTLPRYAPPVKPGPALWNLGHSLAYCLSALTDAATHHARHGTTEGCEVVDPADVDALDQAADQDALDAWADDNAPPDSWEPWCDREVWTTEGPSENDRIWFAVTSNTEGGVPCV